MAGRRLLASAALAVGTLLAACRQDMHDGAFAEPFEHSPLFADGRASRTQVAGTVARGELGGSGPFWTGKDGDDFVQHIPRPIDAALLARGRERFGIFCAPCHDYTGSGRGMVVQRGFKAPQTFHSQRLREAADGYVYDVISNGFGAMFEYGTRIPVEDRWAIVAYVRALQIAWDGRLDDVPVDQRRALEGTQ